MERIFKTEGLEGTRATRLVSESIENFKPIGNYILVKPEIKKEVKGIIIPKADKDRESNFGLVIRVGNGKTTKEGKVIPIDIREGDRIIYSKYAATRFKRVGDENDPYVIMPAEEVLGVC